MMTPEELRAFDRWLKARLEGETGTAPPGGAEGRAKAERLLRYATKPPAAFEASPAGDPDWAEGLAAGLADTGGVGPGVRVGAFEIERAIGAGGMGAVYRARRVEGGFEQRVALKVLAGSKPGAENYRQFQREREVLSRLEHANIARLIDGGMTEDWRPWFAMEYVDGLPIDRYADKHRLGIDQRLELFRQVCGALEYAHGQLVLHRDIKPSNILVTAAGEVKLLDFGLGKILEDLDEIADGSQTRSSLGWLTPDYASPEQVRGQTVNVTSEVYQLGVLLYRLLSARPPYQVADTSPREIVRAVCEFEPARPSEHWRANGDGPRTRAAYFRTRPEMLRRRLTGDLDNIVMMAMAKEPHRRYASVAEFSEDVKRHTEHRPVHARRHTRGYLIRRYIRRNPVGVGLGALSALLLTTGLVATAWQAHIAGQERDRAQLEMRTTERVSEFLVNLFEQADPYLAPDHDITARDLVDRGGERVESLEESPLVQAQMYQALGRANSALGEYERAKLHLRQALGLMRMHGHTKEKQAAAWTQLSRVLNQLGKFEDAEAADLTALGLLESESGPVRAEVLSNLGMTLRSQGRLGEAEAHLREAVRLYEDDEPEGLGAAGARHKLGYVLFSQTRYADARDELSRALEIRRRLLGSEHPITWETSGDLGNALGALGDLDAAQQLMFEELKVQQRILGADHPRLAAVKYGIGILETNRGRHAEARDWFNRALEIRLQALSANHPSTGMSHYALGAVSRRLGELDEAEYHLNRALDIYDLNYGERHIRMADLWLALGNVKREQGDFETAKRQLKRSLDIRLETLGEHHQHVANSFGALADLHRETGDLEAALHRARSALDVNVAVFAESDHPNILASREKVEELEAMIEAGAR